MRWLPSIVNRYNSIIWIRLFGTALTTFGSFMIRPFLAIYLYDKLDQNLLISALIVGLQPAVGFITNLFAGKLADRYGRKPIMLISLFLESLAMLCYAFAESLPVFAVITMLHGAAFCLFEPAASAQISDVVPMEKRSEVFAILHMAANIGIAAGSFIGVFLYKVNPSMVFIFSSIVLFLYGMLVLWKVPETLPVSVNSPPLNTSVQTNETKMRILKHKNLIWVTLSMLPFTLLYSQVVVVLPQHLKINFDDYLNIYASLLTINAVIVVLFQILISKIAERFSVSKVIFFTYICLAITSIGYAWVSSFSLLIFVEIIFTVGEMLNGPQIRKVISLMAPPDFRGRYFAIFGAHEQISEAIGPALGVFVLSQFGGGVWFTILSLLLLISGFLQKFLISHILQTKKQGHS
ncbi:MDR family MFS transporter [Bacillus wiedmannii]|uniref:MDR family MFS transporter n=1 Tax=Bacillus wiedmannii TaxID=1890302 RepID=UPI000BEC86DE|nr:MFS transporter [Bacillus wiedmannii]PEF38679.1 MFS transporter [Bacillus wiedmannii]